MHPRRGRITGIVAVVAPLIAVAAAGQAKAQEQDLYRRISADKDPSLVTIKFVLKLKMGSFMGGGDQETESEVTGTMIDPKGLVLCSNTQLLGYTGMLSRMMGGMAGGMSATPTELKVLVGDDTEGLEAELIARDTELDLAWIKIKEPGDRKFDYVDFSKGAELQVGRRILVVRRMGKFFSRATVVIQDRIGGTTTTPRELFIPAAGYLATALGLPVYLPDGTVVGVCVTQAPEEEEAGGGPMMMMTRISGMQESMTGFILPAADVVKATRRALESAESN